MASIENAVAAAVAVVDYDLYNNVPGAEIQRGQRVHMVAITGSAAVGDTRVRFMAGTEVVAWLYNNALGVPGRDQLIPCDYVHQGDTVRLYAMVTDAPATNPIYPLMVVG